MPVILLVGNKKDKVQEREVEKFDAERVKVTSMYIIIFGFNPLRTIRFLKIRFFNDYNRNSILNAYHCYWLQGNSLKLYMKIFA